MSEESPAVRELRDIIDDLADPTMRRMFHGYLNPVIAELATAKSELEKWAKAATTFSQCQSELASVKAQLASCQNSLEAITSQRDRNQADLVERTQQLAAVTEERDKGIVQYEDLRNELNNLQERLDTKGFTLNQVREELAACRAELEAARASNAELRAILERGGNKTL